MDSRTSVRKIGLGLRNHGANCYMNCVLQVLTHTTPLTNLLLGPSMHKLCGKHGHNTIYYLTRHMRLCLLPDNEGTLVTPVWAGQNKVQALKAAGAPERYKDNHQEDAHEFLRLIVDALHTDCLVSVGKSVSDPSESLISRIFHGKTENRVQCMQCQSITRSEQVFSDLTLCFQYDCTLEEALQDYVRVSKLNDDNAYDCKCCQKKVFAKMKTSIQKAPQILTVLLQRVAYFHRAFKQNNTLRYSEKLDLRPFMSNSKGPPLIYSLYGVIIHEGVPEAGHYYSYIKGRNKQWYKFDDWRVLEVHKSVVLNNKGAYMLLYSRDAEDSLPDETSTSSERINKQQRSEPLNAIQPSNCLVNGHAKKQADNDSSVLKRPTVKHTHHMNGVIPSHKPATTFENGSGSNKNCLNVLASSHTKPVNNGMLWQSEPVSSVVHDASKGVELPLNREKVSFSLKHKPLQSSWNSTLQHSNKNLAEEKDNGRHVVLKIQTKDWHSETVEKFSDGKEHVVESSTCNKEKSALVPYEDDSSDAEPEQFQSSVTFSEKNSIPFPKESNDDMQNQAQNDYVNAKHSCSDKQIQSPPREVELPFEEKEMCTAVGSTVEEINHREKSDFESVSVPEEQHHLHNGFESKSSSVVTTEDFSVLNFQQDNGHHSNSKLKKKKKKKKKNKNRNKDRERQWADCQKDNFHWDRHVNQIFDPYNPGGKDMQTMKKETDTFFENFTWAERTKETVLREQEEMEHSASKRTAETRHNGKWRDKNHYPAYGDDATVGNKRHEERGRLNQPSWISRKKRRRYRSHEGMRNGFNHRSHSRSFNDHRPYHREDSGHYYRHHNYRERDSSGTHYTSYHSHRHQRH